MDLQGWDPGDQRLLRDNWKVLRNNQRADLHPYDVFFGGWKPKGVFERNVFPDLRRNLWSLGKFYTTRRGESEGSSISFRLREFSSRIFQPRDLCGRILVLIKTRSQDLSGLRFNGCRTDIIRSVLLGKWRHMRRSKVLMTSRRWDSGVGGGFWWGLVDWQSENQGVVEWRLPWNLRGVDLVIEKGNFGKLRRLGISANWITISIIIKTKSKGYTDIFGNFRDIWLVWRYLLEFMGERDQ
ncbi:PREDICTED: uncharacterized protein LOC106319061 isoform X2 [Brassica oleracea var. oleracea]|uniref:uncharacterized protein LOC106319061 isoform X2 n=1 Tax=Brassica oleracea var. oleracea TaxID=109376 RepID=UPI0006A72833|nr:PREDICTED: uncharacterized protein LOC106319061 isoform X2 [Brassica oleracea var. oleracea]